MSWPRLLLACVTGGSPALAQGLVTPAQEQTAASQGRCPCCGPSGPFLGGVPSGTPTPNRRADRHGRHRCRARSSTTSDVLNAEQRGRPRAGHAVERARATCCRTSNGRVTETRQQVNLAAFGFPLPPGIPSHRRPVQRLRRARLPVADRLRSARDQRRARGGAQRRARRSTPSRARATSSCSSSANAYLAGAGRGGARRLGAGAAADRRGALQPGGRPEAARPRRRHRRAARRGAARAPQRQRDHGGAERVREGQAAARADHRPAARASRSRSTDELPVVPVPDMTLEQALERALPDAARLPGGARAGPGGRGGRAVRSSARRCRRCASTPITARIGLVARRRARHLFASRGAVTMPIFQGGRTTRPARSKPTPICAAARAEADGSEGRHLLRRAHRVPRSARRRREQLQVATRARDLAAQQLTQARDRFAAGVAEQHRGRPGAGSGGASRASSTSRRCTASTSPRRCSRAASASPRRPRVNFSEAFADGRSWTDIVHAARAAFGIARRGRRCSPSAPVVWWWLTAGRESTDDAQVDAHVTQIAARVSGTVAARRRRRQPAGRSRHRAGRARSARLPGGGRQGARRAGRRRSGRAGRAEQRADHVDHRDEQRQHRAQAAWSRREARIDGRGEGNRGGAGRGWSPRRHGCAKPRRTPPSRRATSSGCAGCSRRTKSRSSSSTRRSPPPTRRRPRPTRRESQIAEAEAGIRVAESRLAQARAGEQQARADLRTAQTGPDAGRGHARAGVVGRRRASSRRKRDARAGRAEPAVHDRQGAGARRRVEEERQRRVRSCSRASR